MQYAHIVIDNGSKDGSYEWLKEEGFNVIRNEENMGITFATKQGYDWLTKIGVDIIIQMDSDCEVITPNILAKINEFFTLNSQSSRPEKFVIGPVVKGIDTPPKIALKETLGKFKIDRIGHMGGIFRAMMMKDYTEAMLGCGETPYGDDRVINAYFTSHGFKMGYLSELEINHFETTKGQEKRYPEYFNKKYIY
jgi:glycosyltransferase involved in cell wall biosynthesis